MKPSAWSSVSSVPNSPASQTMRWTRSCAFAAAGLIALFLLKLSITGSQHHSYRNHVLEWTQSIAPESTLKPTSKNVPPSPPSWLHPTAFLSGQGLVHLDSLLASQSQSLNKAVEEYKRRYGIPPPPHFDAWYRFAQSKDVVLIDEFDNIHHSLTPFWALQPASIRSRVREALGYEPNGFITLQIRTGEIARLEGGPDWQLDQLREMIKPFVHLLPDLDLPFNLHDEPRVVIPNDELSKMVRIATSQIMPMALSNSQPANVFSPRPDDMDDARRKIRVPGSSRFNEYQHQPVWGPSRMSCSVDSPSRDFNDNAADDTASYALGDLGFIYNQTAFSDICFAPSLRTTYGFFQRPNAFKVSHELVPVFSQSKISSFQDILYPSPWYYYGKTVTDQSRETHKAQYNESRDIDWDAKNTTLWWRGSTTGGFSREGGWRHQHRQIFVSNINAKESVRILADQSSSEPRQWETTQALREDYSGLVDVHFSSVGQCDPGDCDAQREYFEMAPPVDSQEAWKHKFLLDMDGNAFSGRFYSFLRSKSLPFKMSIFREWHQDWLIPWVHYVPLSLQGDESLETIRYLANDEEGKESASRMAKEGREWAGKVLRNVDMEVWFFRLLLEYARVVDENRLSIGFAT